MAANSSARAKTLRTRPANAFGLYDSVPFTLIDVNRASKSELVQHLRITPEAADRIVALRRAQRISDLQQLLSVAGLPSRTFNRIRGRVLLAGDPRLHILDVTASDDYIFSRKPFALRVHFANPSDLEVAIVSVAVLWAGESFVVEQELTSEEVQQCHVDVRFDEERSLPVGPAEFHVALYSANGAQGSFQKTFCVLPSNPLSLSLSPAGATVTGTWSARGDYQDGSDTFLTECEIAIANGDTGIVSMNRRVNWKFWDGGVGVTLVESGAFDWPGPVSVPERDIWRGSVQVTSPRGSGIYNRYNGKEDMTIEIEMVAADGRHVAGTITCRVMLAYGVNIIKVGDFTAQEGVDLYSAVDITRQIYERRSITFRSVLRKIIHDADAGSYRIINSEAECYDLFRNWSVPNDYIDVYVCQDFLWGGTLDGFSGGIPGPAAKGGDRDGVAVDKTGFTDGSGVKRLKISYLGMLIAHEVGHYLGLPHLQETGNLMLAYSVYSYGANNTNLNYDQYQLMLPHGFIVFL